MKSGVYFVHYNHIDAFLKEAEKSGRRPLTTSTYDYLTNEEYANLYRVFSLDSEDKSYGNRIGYWDAMNTDTLEAMKTWDDWDYTERYIEHWQPNKKKIIL